MLLLVFVCVCAKDRGDGGRLTLLLVPNERGDFCRQRLQGLAPAFDEDIRIERLLDRGE